MHQSQPDILIELKSSNWENSGSTITISKEGEFTAVFNQEGNEFNKRAGRVPQNAFQQIINHTANPELLKLKQSYRNVPLQIGAVDYTLTSHTPRGKLTWYFTIDVLRKEGDAPELLREFVSDIRRGING